jgi:hypothetical protein
MEPTPQARPDHRRRDGVEQTTPRVSHTSRRPSGVERMRLRLVVTLCATVALAACTASSGTQGAVSSLPVATSSSATASNSEAPRVIELPPLTDTGLAALWSRANNSVGVSLVTLRGRVLATVHNVTIYEAGRTPPGLVILNRGDRQYWVLDVSAHELRRVSPARAYKLVQQHGPASLPSDAFAWSVAAPGSTQVLGQYWQQVSECQKPIALLRSGPGAQASPVTGDPLVNAQPSYALGWSDDSEAVVFVARGPCDPGTAQFHDGVYLFDTHGGVQRLKLPVGSYAFQMWS